MHPGLPEFWKRDDNSDYKAGSFDLEGNLPGVVANVNLIKGLFNESLPAFLRKQAAYGAADSPLTFLHVDCDLYRGAADVFALLAHKIVPGTVIVFDDLVRLSFLQQALSLCHPGSQQCSCLVSGQLPVLLRGGNEGMVGVSAGGVVCVLHYPCGLPPWWKTHNAACKYLTLWLQASGAKFATIGMLGPLPGKTYAMVRPPASLHACCLTQPAGVTI